MLMVPRLRNPALGLLHKVQSEEFLYNLVPVSLLNYFLLSDKNFVSHHASCCLSNRNYNNAILAPSDESDFPILF